MLIRGNHNSSSSKGNIDVTKLMINRLSCFIQNSLSHFSLHKNLFKLENQTNSHQSYQYLNLLHPNR